MAFRPRTLRSGQCWIDCVKAAKAYEAAKKRDDKFTAMISEIITSPGQLGRIKGPKAVEDRYAPIQKTTVVKFAHACVIEVETIIVENPEFDPPMPDELNQSLIVGPDRFFGRDILRDSLIDPLLREGGTAVLILGVGGVGKTTLARAAASHEKVSSHFGPRRFEVALATAHSAAAMQDLIATTLGVDPKLGVNGIRDRLTEANTLLYLDNLEAPWDVEQGAVEAVLRSLADVPGLALLATIRGTESPRSPRWLHRLDLPPLNADAARELFTDIAHRISRDDPKLDALLVELARLPLAIELVAREAEADDDLARVTKLWQSVGPALPDSRADAGDPHRSLSQSIELSLGSARLKDEGRRLLRLLGALPGGLAEVDEAPLLGGDAVTARRQLQAVGVAHQSGNRIDLLPPVRRHAIMQHPATVPEQHAWISHYLGLVRDVGDRIGRDHGRSASERLLSDASNIEEALALAPDNGLLGAAISAAPGYHRMAYFLGLNARSLLDLAKMQESAGGLAEAAKLYAFGADVALARNEKELALKLFEKSRSLFEGIPVNTKSRQNISISIANCIRKMGDIFLKQGMLEKSKAYYLESLSKFENMSRPSYVGLGECKLGLAEVAVERASFREALVLYNDARESFERVANKRGCAGCYKGTAKVEMYNENFPAALDAITTAINLFEEIGALIELKKCSNLQEVIRQSVI